MEIVIDWETHLEVSYYSSIGTGWGKTGIIMERLNGELSEQVNAVNRVWDEFESEQTTLNNLLKYTSQNWNTFSTGLTQFIENSIFII